VFTGLPPFTLLHVILSLVGIVTGFIVLAGLVNAKKLDGWTAIFLASTVLTSVTGFFLPATHFMPSHAIGILSLIVLSIAIAARYPFNLQGHWRRTYVVAAMIALYFNFFVLIVQSFMKIDALKALAPTQSEPPFMLAQLLALILFVVLTIVARRRFAPRSEPPAVFTARAHHR
jgi:hypothetical protein